MSHIVLNFRKVKGHGHFRNEASRLLFREQDY